MRSSALGCIVTQHSLPSSSASGAPRTLLIVPVLPISERAAVAPSATVTAGWISSRSCSIHQRQAAISRGYESSSMWALARDGNALLYGNELFKRSNGAWVCP